MIAKKPDLDEPTLRILQRMLSAPPKPHGQMKVGKKPKTKLAKSPGKRKTKAKNAS